MNGFGDAVRQLMAEREVSLRALAKQISYDVAYLSRTLAGKQRPSPELVTALDDALGASGQLTALTLAGVDTDPWETAELLRRLQLSDVGGGGVEQMEQTVERLCCEYPYRPAADLLGESRQWLRYVGRMVRGNVTLTEHRNLLVLAGWLALLVGCVEYDMGRRTAAESTRLAAARIGRESEEGQVIGWAFEMEAWFALTNGDAPAALAAARAGQDASGPGSASVQLAAQEAKALARLGEVRALHETLDAGYRALGKLPRPSRPSNHFIIDPDKWDFYAMDCYRVVGDNDRAEHHARRVLKLHTMPDGTERSPMRMSEARFTLAHVALRQDDLELAVGTGRDALAGRRRSIPHMMMSARELAGELDERYPHERLATEFREYLRSDADR